MRKTGHHVQDWTGDAFSTVMRSRGAILKVMTNSVGQVRSILAGRPDTIIVVRRYWGDGEQQDFIGRKEAGGADCASQVIRHFAGIVALHPHSLFIEGLNETGLWESADNYCRFTVGFAQECARQGQRPAVYSFPVGNPSGYETPGGGLDLEGYWRHYFDGLYAAKAANGALALHEYSWPTMQTGASWYCLRYRRAYAVFPEDLKQLPLLLTETGLDKGVATGVPDAANNAGWKAGDQTADQYAAQLKWYDAELSKDRYVLGSTIFLCGGYWPSFDVAGCQPIIDAIREETEMPLTDTTATLIGPSELHAYSTAHLELEMAGVDDGTFILTINLPRGPGDSAVAQDPVVAGALGPNLPLPEGGKFRLVNGRNVIQVEIPRFSGAVDDQGSIHLWCAEGVWDGHVDPEDGSLSQPLNQSITIHSVGGAPEPQPPQPGTALHPNYDALWQISGDAVNLSREIPDAVMEEAELYCMDLIRWRKGELSKPPFPVGGRG